MTSCEIGLTARLRFFDLTPGAALRCSAYRSVDAETSGRSATFTAHRGLLVRIDWAKISEAAYVTGTAIEINSVVPHLAPDAPCCGGRPKKASSSA